MRAVAVPCLLASLVLAPPDTFGQQGFPINVTADPDTLAKQLLGPGVTIVPDSARFIGSPQAAGTFTGAQGILPFDSGVVLSTGALPASSDGIAFLESLGQNGDTQLSQILGAPTFDAAVLEFQFIPTESELAVPFVFGTDEFPEFVGTEFNDGFVFLVNGVNVAVVPGTGQLVSVNTINSTKNSQFFTDNQSGVVLVSLNGLAGLPPNELVAVARVVPGKPNTIRIVIADATDDAITSAVALGGLVLAIPPTSGNEVTADILTEKSTTQLVNVVITHISSVVNALFGRQIKTGAPVSQSSRGVIPVAHGEIYTGTSAGEGFRYPWGVWGSYQHVFTEDDFPTTAFDADTDQLTFGVDMSPTDNVVTGIAVSYETTDADTTFNRGEQEMDGISIVPYVGFYLSDVFGVSYDITADLSFGYSSLEIDQFRTNFFGQRVTGELDSDRWFGAVNVSASRAFGGWYLTGRTGLLFVHEVQEAFVESDLTPVDENIVQVAQFRLGGEAAYTLSGGGLGSFEPFIGATYQNDFHREEVQVAFGRAPANDNDDVLLSVGLRYYGSERVSATLQYDKVLSRENFDLDAVSLLVRAQF